MNLTGPIVDIASHHRQILGIGADRGPFREVFADDAVEVLVAAAFPRGVRVGEEAYSRPVWMIFDVGVSQ